LTRVLHRELRARETVGIDRSAAMLAKSRPLSGSGLRFERGDIGAFSATQRYDLVFSNAALHWISDHEALLGRLTAALAKEGQLAVQVPANHDHPSHRTARAVAREAPFREALGGYVHRPSVLSPERYAALLERFGYRAQHVRLQIYGYRLREPGDVVEWVAGTTLTVYRERLSADLYARFVDRYRESLLAQIDDGGPYFFAFKRILLWGRL